MIDMEQARDRAPRFRWGVPADVLWAAAFPTRRQADDQARAFDPRRGVHRRRRGSLRRRVVDQLQPAKAFYEGQQRYQGLPYTYERVTAAIAEGVALGLLEEERAKPGAHLAKDPRQSRFRATRDLLSSFQDSPFEYRRRPSPIMLRDADGQPIPLPTTQAVQRLRREMEALEPYFGSIRLTLGQGDGWEYAKRTLRARSDRTGGWANVTPEPCLHPVRIFSRASMSKGGSSMHGTTSSPRPVERSASSTARSSLSPTSRPYTEAAPRLEGVEMRHDPYEVAECPRPHAKRALNTLINARSRMQAAASLYTTRASLRIEPTCSA